MTRARLRVNLRDRSYSIVVDGDDPGGVGAFAASCTPSRRSFVVTDANAAAHIMPVSESLRVAGFETRHHVLPPGEATKSLAFASQLYDALAEFRADRKTLVVAIGGGVVGDLAGFAAATFNRGLPLLMLPTTLLAMVDSSVGGKVGINHPMAKNLIGAFHQPVGVWIDTATLTTLPEREFRSGLAEVVKYGVALDAEFFHFCEQNVRSILDREPDALGRVIARSCELKAGVVERDEREETGLRAVLNYGHTFAHAIETIAGYGYWLHGEAVSAGMACACRLAERRGLVSAEVTERQAKLLHRFGLPTQPEPWQPEELLTIMRNDKKASAGKLRFVLPRRLGEVALFDDVPESDVLAVLREGTAVAG